MTNQEYESTVSRHLEGCQAVSTGICPGCIACADEHGFRDDLEGFAEAVMVSGFSERYFSWHPCGICGSQFGGDRESWHWVDGDGEIVHEDGACTDCVLYLANGDLPNREEAAS